VPRARFGTSVDFANLNSSLLDEELCDTYLRSFRRPYRHLIYTSDLALAVCLPLATNMASGSSKRHSVLPTALQAGPKAPVNLSSSVLLADTAVLTGTDTVTINSESVIHPRAKLESSNGPVTVGRRCIVYERSHIGAAGDTSEEAAASKSSQAVTLGDYVTVEVGAVIEAGNTVICEGSVIGVGARIGRGAVIGKVVDGSLSTERGRSSGLRLTLGSTALLQP
jgi:carbonic anhydrase/acetyltransferase-like protein (isoleucine patch superfamily)